jgi:GTP-binding protein Era
MKAGFVCLSGAPSVGKSTLVNAFMKEKVSIVSEKPQTTRNRINAILTSDEVQIIFADTPGVHKPFHKLGRYLLKIALSALEGNDLILFVIAANRVGEADKLVAEKLKEIRTPVIGVLNKMDVADTVAVEKARTLFEEVKAIKIFEISAMKDKGVEELLKRIVEMLPESQPYYPNDLLTDKPATFMISEIVREKIFLLTHEELPYSSRVEVEEIEKSDNLTKIYATIFIERASQKAIILGKGGSMIKQIGILARKDIEYLLDTHVFLSLHVKVKSKWTDDERELTEMFRGEIE